VGPDRDERPYRRPQHTDRLPRQISRLAHMNSNVKILESPDGLERVIIAERSDGHFTYRRQWRSEAARFDSGASISADTLGEIGWGATGPDCGIYDSPDSAEMEARQRVPWLRMQFH
jgi:hypothetical protein